MAKIPVLFSDIHGERSSVGRASGCGSEGRGFDPHRSPQLKKDEISHNGRGVAQLVAHSLWERGVVSSSLAAPTIFIVRNFSVFLFLLFFLLALPYTDTTAQHTEHFKHTVQNHAATLVPDATAQDLGVLANLFYCHYQCEVRAIQQMICQEKLAFLVAKLSSTEHIQPSELGVIGQEYRSLQRITQEYETYHNYYNHFVEALEQESLGTDVSIKTSHLENIAHTRLQFLQEWAHEHMLEAEQHLQTTAEQLNPLVTRFFVGTKVFQGLAQQLNDHPDEARDALATSYSAVRYYKEQYAALLATFKPLEKMYKEFFLFSAQLDWYYYAYFYRTAQSVLHQDIPVMYYAPTSEDVEPIFLPHPDSVSLTLLFHDAD